MSPKLFTPRAAQKEFSLGSDRHRLSAMLARRQFGKTTLTAWIALKKMMRTPGHDVVFGSVKLDLGREIVRKEAAALRNAMAVMEAQSAGASKLLELADSNTGRKLPDLKGDDFAELYEACRLEMRLYHSNSVFSRTKVVALTPDAVGETGDLILDEVGRIKKFREVWEAVLPIISSNPNFRCILTTTPPPDDAHFSFELLAPPLGIEFPVNPKGNWYKSELNVWVLRVDAFDAQADGVPMYDLDTGAAITPEQSRAAEADKDAWDRNYGVNFVLGGTAACGLIQLGNAQQRGIGKCACIVVESDMDFDRAIHFLREKLTDAPVGIGGDLATTEKETSNPTSVTVMERHGVEVVAVLTVVWKTRDPALATERFRRIAQTVRQRKAGGPARRLCVDATNERYFASALQKELSGEVAVELVISSETIELPGREPITRKAHLGNQLIGELDDNHLTLAPERYIKDDFRLVKRDRGTFVADISPSGQHADTFDSHKLALEALQPGGGYSAELI